VGNTNGLILGVIVSSFMKFTIAAITFFILKPPFVFFVIYIIANLSVQVNVLLLNIIAGNLANIYFLIKIYKQW